MEGVLWQKLITQYMGKKHYKNARKIALDLMAVDAGLKPCLLFDYALMEGKKMGSILEKALHDGLLKNQLQVFFVKEDMFIYHNRSLTEYVENCSSACYKMVDISSANHCAAFLDENKSRECIKLFAFRTLDMLKSVCRDEVGTLEFTEDINYPSLFGFLLGYPCIYWFQSYEGDSSNCISMVPLQNVTLTCQLSKNSFGQHATKFIEKHTIYSFSYPKSLHDEISKSIELWSENIHSKASKQTTFDNIELKMKEIIMPYLTL